MPHEKQKSIKSAQSGKFMSETILMFHKLILKVGRGRCKEYYSVLEKKNSATQSRPVEDQLLWCGKSRTNWQVAWTTLLVQAELGT
jgi:hypothetical protein